MKRKDEDMDNRETDRLLSSIRAGSDEAFAELYVKTKRGIFSFLYTYYHNFEDTEDAMQTAYLKIKTNIGSYRPGTNGRAWLLEVAKNVALNDIRKKKKAEAEITAEPGYFEFDDGSVTDLMERNLTADEARIVTLHVLWNYKHREIAKIMNLPLGTVTSKYKRSVEKLRNALKGGSGE